VRTSPQDELEWMINQNLIVEAADHGGEVRYVPTPRFKRQLAKHLSDLEETESDPAEAVNKAVLKTLIDMANSVSREDTDRLYVRMNIMLSILPRKNLVGQVVEDMEEIHRMKAFRAGI